MTIGSLAVAAGMALADVPVDPDAPEAKQWLIHELGKPEYQAAKPTWFDLVSKAFWDWLTSLFQSDGSGWPGLVPLIVTAIVVAVVVVAFVLFGLPRLNRRRRAAPALFGEDDRRTAEQIRRAAADAARRGDWSTAVEEAYRALARGLEERTVVTVLPGTTARAVAEDAAGAFPRFRDRLVDASMRFDRIRYGGTPGTEADYRVVSDLDREASSATPARLPQLDGALS